MTPIPKAMLPQYSQEVLDHLKKLPARHESYGAMMDRIEAREIEASKKFQAEMAARKEAAKKE